MINKTYTAPFNVEPKFPKEAFYMFWDATKLLKSEGAFPRFLFNVGSPYLWTLFFYLVRWNCSLISNKTVLINGST